MSQISIATPTPTRNYAGWMLIGVSFAHLLNDAMQSIVPASFPLLRESMNLSFAQVGWVAFTLNVTASVLQPLIGYYADRRPMPSLLPIGMLFSLVGVLGFALASTLWMLLFAAALIGIGSSVLHPESSRVAHMAAGKGRGMAQSIFQVGGNTGQALAPLMVAFVLAPLGQHGFLWMIVLAMIGLVVQMVISRWYRQQLNYTGHMKKKQTESDTQTVPNKGFIIFVMGILMVLLFSKFVYIAGMTGYYSFYYVKHYQLPLPRAQVCLFVLQFAGMIGTLLGGKFADRFGRKKMIWFSIAGTAPFSILLPYASPAFALILCFLIGLILMSGFSVIIVYAQELLPSLVGTVSGLFFGFSFGMAGLGSVILGSLMDKTSVEFVIQLCAFLPLLGIFAFLLPSDARLKAAGRV
ncbi:MFS transporter [Paenibacillus pini]|uniref:Fosmidomycin resistance protein n=1 Tax=Paenibacillus pini JCM 16418 TaxID=1236976 RepID=W7Z241_9BACL|nr:MFS transporter [Paenibacillus pini]GAF08479.1 fosmidomycin resistance protein [Paenibacillus pini JCM 16418]